MSPQAGSLLLSILPIITSAIRRDINLVGCEDEPELVQDAAAVAAGMLDSAERKGKTPLPRSVAYYALQTIKSGRRSTQSGRTDVYSSAALLDGSVHMLSCEQVVVGDADEDITIGNMIADKGDDPGTEAMRNLDWQELLDDMPERDVDIITGLAQGKMSSELAADIGVSRPRITQSKNNIADRIRSEWGSDILNQTADKPLWRRTHKFV